MQYGYVALEKLETSSLSAGGTQISLDFCMQVAHITHLYFLSSYHCRPDPVAQSNTRRHRTQYLWSFFMPIRPPWYMLVGLK